MNTESMISAPVITSSAWMSLAFFCPTSSPNARMPRVSAVAQPLLVGAAVGGRDGVAIIRGVAVAPDRPGDRPFDRALAVREILPAGEGRVGRASRASPICSLQMIGEAARELEHRLGGRLVGDQLGIAAPAYLDAGEEIGLGARQPVEPRRLELRVLAENLGIGGEGDGGAAPVLGRAQLDQLRGRQAAGEGLAVELLVARDLDHRVDRQAR